MRQQVYEMARRAVIQTLRQPALIIPPIVFPLIMMAINTGGLHAAVNLPGFPADTYLDFAIAVPFMQGSLFACINAGAALARDVESGFLKRLAMTPMQRAALLMGQLGGVMLVAGVLERFGTPVTARPGAAAVRLHGGVDQLAEVVRTLDGESLTITDFRLHAPTLDDVFLAKTGRKLEGGEPSAEPEAVPA